MTVAAPPRRLVLDNRVGWRMDLLTEVDAADTLRLASHPVRPRPLADPSGALAGLTAPIWAAACGQLGIACLDGAGARVLVYDPCLEQFATFPCLAGLQAAHALAFDGAGLLWIAETGARRLLVIDLVLGRVVRTTVGPWAAPRPVLDQATGLPTGAWDWPPGTWEPTAVLALPQEAMLVADRAGARLWRVDRRGRRSPFAANVTLVAPSALAQDRDHRIYVVQDGLASVRVLNPDGSFAEDVSLPDPIAGRFDSPAVSVDADGVIWIGTRIDAPTWRLRRAQSGRCLPPEPVRPLPGFCTMLAFDRDGAAILGDARRPCVMRASERAYAPIGTALTGPLDSGLPGCLWDLVTLTASLPSGTRLMIDTFTADAAWSDAEIVALPADRWRSAQLTVTDADGTWDAAVLSPPGRYLWLRLTFSGDGTVTPEISRMEVNWPRVTSRRFLPSSLSPDPESADFLDRFMLAFDRVRTGYTQKLDLLAAFFDPLATPAADPGTSGPDFLDWLGAWIGVALERNWPVAARRRLVRQAASLFRLRGTPAGLKRHVALYTGVEPKLIEHFRLRRWLTLGTGRLDGGLALYGPEVVARLQLDVFAQTGQFELIDTGDPLTDPFGAYAHRATLLVPAADPADARYRATVERIVALAAPAHVEVSVRLLAAGFRVGCNAVLGAATRLPQRAGAVRLDTTQLDTPARLAGAQGFRLGPRGGARLGADTRLRM
jgi:phage tail-like protein